ncbi:T9SS type A sorting domain-containing protein [Flavobacterium sp. D11R37]|uniref:T9SS type A sorting domain-containing protein n=1 Tax=Flavobacterium coralii TaxID=2838017 RepID=UPI001CA78221|nr:T9SS type A sorting domain-containing protein [Flavobacterium coralii]MBY8962900.1 T9SS type A sorting domain-containing protein [Flavobacterium coralii]
MKNNSNIRSIFLAAFFGITPMVMQAQELPKVFGKTIHAESINSETGKIRCVTTEYEEYLQENSPERATNDEFEQWIAQKITARKTKSAATGQSTTEVITIPIVVHVVHNGDFLGTNENIADAQVLSQITVLNQDYRRMLGTPGYNSNPVGADVQIEFCLAQVDPDGQPTTGIDRVNMNLASWSESQVEDVLKPSTIWDPTRYFNIWVCNFGSDLSDVLGYAQFPSQSGLNGLNNYEGSASTDGVIIGYKYFGSQSIYPQGDYQAPYNRGRTTTHEIGHALGLLHIWGNSWSNNSCSFSDYCDDTPASNGPNSGCSQHYSCTSYDMIENYMDYTYDSCMNIFTQDQKERILAVLDNSPRRASLKTSTVCSALAGSEDFKLLNGINLYPNPATSVLNIAVADNDLPDSYMVYNSLGQAMVSVTVTSASSLTVDTSSYSNGIYFIRIDKGNESKVLKFIKK